VVAAREGRPVALGRALARLDRMANGIMIVKPETVIAWHRRGFRLWWAWTSRGRIGRPTVPADIRTLIRTMAEANPHWGAPRMHGELLKLGIDVCQATVARYMVRQRRPPSQTWRTFLRNHSGRIVAADFFVVPTATYRLLVLLAHDRRGIRHVADDPSIARTSNGRARPCRWTKTRRLPGRSCRLVSAPSWRSRRSVVSIIGTSGARPEGTSRDRPRPHERRTDYWAPGPALLQTTTRRRQPSDPQ
jgi:hypothetical protein